MNNTIGEVSLKMTEVLCPNDFCIHWEKECCSLDIVEINEEGMCNSLAVKSEEQLAYVQQWGCKEELDPDLRLFLDQTRLEIIYEPDNNLIQKMNRKMMESDMIKKNVSEVTYNLLLAGAFKRIEVQLKLEDDSSE